MEEKHEIYFVKIEFEDTCRLCGRLKDNCSMDVLSTDNKKLRQRIEKMLKVKIKAKDKLHNICQECYDKLENFNEFYGEVQRVQKELKKDISSRRKTRHTDTSEIKTEIETNILVEPDIKEEPSTDDIIVQELPLISEFQDFDEYSNDSNDENEELECNETQSSKTETDKNISKEEIDQFFKFQCISCGSDCMTLENYVAHMRQDHRIKEPSISCCNVTVRCQRAPLAEHYLSHTTPEDFTCRVCGKKLSTLRIKRRHESEHIQKRKPPDPCPCPHCGKSMKGKLCLNNHIKIYHTPNNIRMQYQCDECGKKMTTKGSILYHLIYKHKKEVDNKHTKNYGEILCQLCAKTFSGLASYRGHLRKVHNDNRRVKCKICEKELKVEYIPTHMRQFHDDQAADCPICFKQFRNKACVLLHKQRVHIEPKHGCDICGKMFKMKDKMKYHRRIHFSNFK